MEIMLHTLGIRPDTPTCIIACHDPRQEALNEFQRFLCPSSMPHKLLRPYGGPIGLSEPTEQYYWQRQLRTAFHKALFFRFVLIGHTGRCRHCEEHGLFPTEDSCEHAFWVERLTEAERFIKSVAQKFAVPGVTTESFIYDVLLHTMTSVHHQPRVSQKHPKYQLPQPSSEALCA